MHASKNRKAPTQAPSANNRAARKRRERARPSNEFDTPQRGIAATSGSKGARRRKKG